MASQRMVPGPLKTLIGLPKAPPAKSTSTQITSLLEVSPGIIRSCSDRLQTVRDPSEQKVFQDQLQRLLQDVDASLLAKSTKLSGQSSEDGVANITSRLLKHL